MPNNPVLPLISSINSTNFVVAPGVDGNPVGTFYCVKILYGVTTKYVTNLGGLQDTPVYFQLTTVTVTGLTPNTLHAVSLAAADDNIGTNTTVFGLAAAVTTLAASPVAAAFSGVFSTTVTSNWTASGNPVGTQYYTELSPDSGFLLNVQNSGWSSEIGHRFVNLLSNTGYYSRVKARNTALVETAYTSLGSIVTLAGPDTVKVVHIFNLLAERGYLISWQPNLETDLAGYRIYRSPSPTDNAAFLFLEQTAISETHYIDRVPYTFGIVWYYKVTAVDLAGNESELVNSYAVTDSTFHSFEEQPFVQHIMPSDFVYDETPLGDVDGLNTLFITLNTYRSGTTTVYLNGVKMIKGTDYVEGPLPQQLTFLDPPDAGGGLQVSYIKYV